jgi:hypothetical protein
MPGYHHVGPLQWLLPLCKRFCKDFSIEIAVKKYGSRPSSILAALGAATVMMICPNGAITIEGLLLFFRPARPA